MPHSQREAAQRGSPHLVVGGVPQAGEDEQDDQASDAADQRDAAKDESELDRARDWRSRSAVDQSPGTRAWRTALATRFDPTLAAEAAEAITETEGRVTDEAAALFRRALVEAPADAPWRAMAQKRLAEAK